MNAWQQAAVPSSRVKPRVLEISSAESLSILRDEQRRAGPRKFTGFVVRVPDATDATNEEWRKRIERDYFACGCAEGTWAALFAVGGCVGWALFRPGGWSALSWTDALLLVGAFVAATGLGKLIGIRAARRRLNATLAELGKSFPSKLPPPASDQPVARCAVGL